MSHLRQPHGALLRRHVAAAGADLRQLRDVVLAVLFRFALRQVGPPADAQRQKKRPVSVARRGGRTLQAAPLGGRLTSSAAR